MIAKRRLFVNADKSKIVDEGSEEAAYLLAGEGVEVSAEDIKKYGLKKTDVGDTPKSQTEASLEAEAEAKAAEAETQAKAVAAPPENKAMTAPAETKAKATTKAPSKARKGKK